MTDLIREINFTLAVIVTFLLCYRIPEALNGVASRRLFIALALYVPVTGAGTVQGYILNAPIGPITFVVTVIQLWLGFVLVRWPKSLRS